MRPTPYQRPNKRAGAALACAVLAFALSGCVAGPSASQPVLGSSEGQGSWPATAAAGATQEPAQAAGSAPGSSRPGGEPLASTSGGVPGTYAAASAAAAEAATDTVKRTVTDTLTKLASGTPKPATGQVSEALTGAGIAPAVLQVSQSRTPTGLEADAIEAAVLQGRDCVIGQVREGAVTVTVLPVLASGKCFVGS
ncbi:DUF6993 domain-containing protein [Arthrobacter sp. FW306-07-I]|uniref:DUF6993 domain-containing protein n=1 Tax=Arthrobacter sp. FW306-07-I TaxID=2879622 RepID=UPI001F3AB53C|nr:hypothetical protein [Arthrobacter sp. FW306-07-I]UKA73892.1 hypothetical protein LFT46_11870 [Arthrobacter sp. FW306-07-I]